jgi:hypothetical protein
VIRVTRMKTASALFASLLIGLLASCSGPPGTQQTTAQAPAAAAQTRDEPVDPSFIGRIWLSTERSDPRGSIMVFLPDRSLLMDSCFETFRISQWGVAGDHIRWVEDAIPIEAKVTMVGENDLRLEITGQDPQSFVAIPVPYVCPDMPR